MTYAELRERVGPEVALLVAAACGIKRDSLRKMARAGSEIPTDRLRCILLALEKHEDKCAEVRRDIENELAAVRAARKEVKP